MVVAMPTPATFAALLDQQLRHAPGAPFITWYDDATGERVELSATTYANWVAKTANLFLDEYLLEPGDTVLVDLPNHWLVPVFLGAAWQVGLAVTTDRSSGDIRLIVTGPEPDQHLGSGVPVLCCALLPFAVRFPDGPPPGTDDYGLQWPGQPDALLGAPCHDAEAIALRSAAGEHSQADLVAAAASASWQGGRLLTDLHPAQAPELTLLAALTRTGSLVLVHDPSPESWTSRSETERTSDVIRADTA